MVSFSFSVLCLYFCHFRGGGRKKRCIGIKRKREKRGGISAQTSKCLEAKNPIQPNSQCVPCLNVFLLETKSSSDFQEIWRWCVETLNLKKKKKIWEVELFCQKDPLLQSSWMKSSWMVRDSPAAAPGSVGAGGSLSVSGIWVGGSGPCCSSHPPQTQLQLLP